MVAPPACEHHTPPHAMNESLQQAFARALPDDALLRLGNDANVVVLAALADWLPWLPALRALLDDDEDTRMRRKRRQSDRQTLQLAYGLRRLLLAALLGIDDPARVPLRRTAGGAPWLQGYPRWATSLSHCDGAVAIAVGRGGPLGVDLEHASRSGVMAEIRANVQHPDDPETVMGDGNAVMAALLALWVRKEAVLKAAGLGLAVPMTSFAAPPDRAIPLPGRPQRQVVARMLEAPEGVLAALACDPGCGSRVAWLAAPMPRSVRPDRHVSCVRHCEPGMIAGTEGG